MKITKATSKELKDGDILLCTGSGLIPNLIKKVTKSTYSHTALFVTAHGCPGVIEAQIDGINWKPFDMWLKKYEYDYEVYRRRTITNSGRERLAVKAFQKAGHVGYDLFSFIIRQPIKIFTGKWKYRGPEREVKFMICSEFVSWVHNFEEWWKHTPDDQKKILEESNKYSLIGNNNTTQWH